MAHVRSTWANNPIAIGGVLSSAEWAGAGQMPIPAGYLMVRNDAAFLYVGLDLVGDRGNDPGPGDYFWLSIDVDGNRQITPRRDTNYALYPGEPNRLARQYYLGPSAWTYPLNEASPSQTHVGFGASPNSSTAHRIWELRLSLEELGVDLNDGEAPPAIGFGVRVASTNPRFTFDYPANFSQDFNNLHQIILARQPEANYLPGTAGAVIGGVGLIPASQIVDGYATTDSSYSLRVDEAVFGGRMNLIGNRVTMQDVWNRGGRKYKILHRAGTTGTFSAVRQSWSNYRWDGTRFVLEHFGPDGDDKYPLLNPGQDYSIDDLLLRWQSVGQPTGIHQFQAQFFNATGVAVTVPSQTLALMVDNNLPLVDVIEVLHNGVAISACTTERMVDNNDGIQFRITVHDREGHLLDYKLVAHYGDDGRAPIISDNYASHRSPTHKWEGVVNGLVPATEWTPPVTCAYQFRLTAHARVTNGYNYRRWVESTRHVTLVKPSGLRAATPAASGVLPFGLLTRNRVEVEGVEPKELGEKTIEDKEK